MQTIKKKKSIVFGGLSGIGSVIVDILSQRGDDCYSVSRRNSSNKNHISFDLTSNQNFPFTKIDIAVFSQRLRTNSSDEFLLMTEKICNFLEQNWVNFNQGASIVLLGSVAGSLIVREQDALYHASRAAIESLVRYYAVNNPIQGGRFNCVIPTTIIKPENKDFFVEDNLVRQNIERITPLMRMGTALDIAHAVEFFTSEKSSFINGQSLLVDGGASLLAPEAIAKIIMEIN